MFEILRHRKVAPWATFFVFLLHMVQVPQEDSLSWLDGWHIDKWVHAGMFSGMTLLWIIYPWKNPPTKWVIPVVLISYSILLEWMQGAMTTYRSGDIWDLTVDVLAILFIYRFRELILNGFGPR
jgi:hypothetical protein